MPLPDSFSATGLNGQQPRWWRAFRDEPLAATIDRALAGNVDLAAAWQRLQAARSLAGVAAAERSPSLDGVASARARRGENDDGEDVDDERFGLGLAASYEIDLWGRIRSRAQAEAFRAEATAADYQAAAISLTATIARTWYDLAAARGELQLLEEQVATNDQVLQLLQSRFGGGLVRQTDLLRQRQLVEAVRGDRSLVAARVDLLRHRLAVLQGLPPRADIPLPEPQLPDLPPPPDTGLPADLVQRRPDVMAAHWSLAAANRELAAAISDQYPRITLEASFETVADDSQDLFRNWLATLAGNLLAPIFDGGRRAAEVDRRQALERERLASYADAVLTAFREVEDALSEERHRRDRLRSLRDQLQLASRTRDRLRQEFLGGVSDYLDVLSALREEQRLQRAVLTSEADVIGTRIDLYRALAGPFALDGGVHRRLFAESDSPSTTVGAAAP